ncbi:MAG: hypothetical protein GX294_08015, partial [Candidatus Cloacimonetes bacterium]|nr:hypothetical protein [Candidatus Cloacimonadota bacterium]
MRDLLCNKADAKQHNPADDQETGANAEPLALQRNTVHEILNIVILFNPMKIFFPTAIVFIILGLGWGTYIALQGKGLSVGS